MEYFISVMICNDIYQAAVNYILELPLLIFATEIFAKTYFREYREFEKKSRISRKFVFAKFSKICIFAKLAKIYSRETFAKQAHREIRENKFSRKISSREKFFFYYSLECHFTVRFSIFRMITAFFNKDFSLKIILTTCHEKA